MNFLLIITELKIKTQNHFFQCIFSAYLMAVPIRVSDGEAGKTVPGDNGIPAASRPPWLDRQLFKEGQEFIKRHVFVVLLAQHVSLVNGFALNNLLQPLVFTKQSDTPMKSLRRYVATAYHIFAWMLGDIWGFPDSQASDSIQKVRSMHRKVATEMNNSGCYPHLCVSQYDMAQVMFGFMGVVICHPEKYGIQPTIRELHAFSHVWRGIAYSLGVEDSFNLCQEDFACTKATCDEALQHGIYKILLPALKNPPDGYDVMTQAYVDGVNLPSRLPTVSRESTICFMLENVGLDSSRYLQLQGWDHVRYYYLRLLVTLVRYLPLFERVMNWLSLKFLKRIGVDIVV